MVPDLDMKAKLDALGVPFSKQTANGSLILENKFIHHAHETKVEMEGIEMVSVKKANVSNHNENVEVNVTDGASSGHLFPSEVGVGDLTESSSSFGNTDSGNESSAYLSDAEVESQFYVGNTSSSISDINFGTCQLRKKKLTEHWKSFVRPLMWRCKWIELQLKQLNSQALKYEKELLFYDQRKQEEFEKFKVDGLDMKSVPFAGQIHRNKIRKRKKRKKVEETTDSTAYISNHNIFSYFEKNKSVVNASMIDESGNRGMPNNVKDEFENTDIWSLLEFQDSDKPLEDIFAKIEAEHSRVKRLKSRVDEVLSENHGKFASLKNKLSFFDPCTVSSHSDQHLVDGDHVGLRSLHMAGQTVGEFNLEDPLVTIQQTSIPFQCHPQSGDFWEDTKDGILIHNQVGKDKLHEYENVGQLMEKPPVALKRPKTISVAEISGSNLGSEKVGRDMKAAGNSRSSPKGGLATNSGRAKRKSAKKNWRNKYSD